MKGAGAEAALPVKMKGEPALAPLAGLARAEKRVNGFRLLG